MINTKTRLSFNIFSTYTNSSGNLTYWDDDELISYVNGMTYIGGYTNTFDVISESIDMFIDDNVSTNRQSTLILITDGLPCLPNSLGGCPQSVCSLGTTIKQNSMYVHIYIFNNL